MTLSPPTVAIVGAGATGLLPPKWPSALSGCESDDHCISGPWAPGAIERIEPTATVTLLGTGLTAIDAVLALEDKGQRGPVHAISRHGLLPCSTPTGRPRRRAGDVGPRGSKRRRR